MDVGLPQSPVFTVLALGWPRRQCRAALEQ
jgi:hypothetical protein